MSTIENNELPYKPEPIGDINEGLTKKTFTNVQVVFAGISIILGFLCIKFVFAGGLGIATSIFFLMSLASSIVFFRYHAIEIRRIDLFYIIILSAFSFSFSIYANTIIKGLTLIFLFLGFMGLYFIICERSHKNYFTGNMIFDAIKAIIIMPLSSMGECGLALNSAGKKYSVGKNLLYIITGLIIAVPTTMTIAYLLMQADDAFNNMFTYLFNNAFSNIVIFLVQVAVGIPFAFYIYGTWMSYAKGTNAELLTQTRANSIVKKLRFAPNIVICTITIPICLLYTMFFASQTAYYFSAFNNILPQSLTYAEYARKGFFELCAVVVINIVVISAITVFTKRTSERPPRLLKIFTVILSTYTLLLIATAISKMLMYIDNYGLSLLRVYTTWFMLLTGLIFILLVLKQFIPSVKIMRSSVAVFILMFGLLTFSDVDAQIAKYNVDCYTSGKFNTVDVNMMYNLSDSAVKYVIPLLQSKDNSIANSAREYLDNKFNYYDSQKIDWRSFNLTSHKAKKLVEEYKATR